MPGARGAQFRETLFHAPILMTQPAFFSRLGRLYSPLFRHHILLHACAHQQTASFIAIPRFELLAASAITPSRVRRSARHDAISRVTRYHATLGGADTMQV